MTERWKALSRVAGDLDAEGVAWALVGGLAVSARTAPRPTADIDVAVDAANDDLARTVVDGLVSAGYRLREWVRHTEIERWAAVRLIAPADAGEVPVDLFFASCGAEAEMVGGAEPLTVADGLTVRVASLGHLIAVKLCWRSGAKRDGDLRRLIGCADRADLDAARALAELITERGYHHGRDLAGSLRTWTAR